MVYSTRRFVLSLALCYFVPVFFSPFGKRELILVLFIRLFDFHLFCFVLSVFSSSWCLVRAAACDCGTPWTSSLTFFVSVWNSLMGVSSLDLAETPFLLAYINTPKSKKRFIFVLR